MLTPQPRLNQLKKLSILGGLASLISLISLFLSELRENLTKFPWNWSFKVCQKHNTRSEDSELRRKNQFDFEKRNVPNKGSRVHI